MGRPDRTSAASAALGPGTTSTPQPASIQAAHEKLARIRDARHPRVAHVHDARAALDRVDDAAALGPFVVPVHNAQPGTRRDTDRAAERTRPAGVFGRDHVGVAQFFDHAR